MEGGGRANQRRRTRKDLLQAAARLIKEGRPPTLEEVAEAALVSRATAYRYFPNIDALLAEATLDMAATNPLSLLASRSQDFRSLTIFSMRPSSGLVWFWNRSHLAPSARVAGSE